MHIGPWNTTPCLILSTELMGQGGIVVNALQVRGEFLLPLRTPGAPGNADVEIRDKAGIPYPNTIHIPARDGKRARTVDGFQVAEADRDWFGQLLARTGAANLTALAGGGPQTVSSPEAESAFIVSVSDTLQEALASATHASLAEAAGPWSETDELRQYGITAETATGVLDLLSGLASRALSAGCRL
ncbi:hypothetical protein NRF20_09470 [Streptomyces sp. R-74717]|uniref:hypothetical protein n=1 Tax=Streptomyces TaxID=1883 RepID=UPI0037A73CF4